MHGDPDIPHKKEIKKFVPKAKTNVTTQRLFEKINSVLDEDMAILADVGDSLFGAVDLLVHDSNQFIAAAFYTSMGTAIPGALGVQIAQPKLRPIVLTGDGSFQMACTELSTIVERGLNPIVIVLNNNGYTTERFLLDGPFNDIRNWNYEEVCNLIGGGVGVKVETEKELDAAIEMSLDSKELTVINVIVDSDDVSPALKRMTAGLSKKL